MLIIFIMLYITSLVLVILTLSHWVVMPLSDEGSDVLWGLFQHLLTQGLSNANSPASHLVKELSVRVTGSGPRFTRPILAPALVEFRVRALVGRRGQP